MTRTVDWSKIRGNGRCHYCDVTLTADTATRDHVVPRSQGGTNALLNLIMCCFDCNQAKADKVQWCKCVTCMGAVAYHLSRMLDQSVV